MSNRIETCPLCGVSTTTYFSDTCSCGFKRAWVGKHLVVLFEPETPIMSLVPGPASDIAVVVWPEAGRTNKALRIWVEQVMADARSHIVLTNSEVVVHRMRLIVAHDPSKMSRIILEWHNQDEWHDKAVGLTEDDESRWPAGFLLDGIDEELEIRSWQIYRRKYGDGPPNSAKQREALLEIAGKIAPDMRFGRDITETV